MSQPLSSREVFMLGNVVRLKRPHSLDTSDVQQLLKPFRILQPWQGFTYGVIAERIAPNALGLEQVAHPILMILIR